MINICKSCVKFMGHHPDHFLMEHQVGDSSYDGSAICLIPVHRRLVMDQPLCAQMNHVCV